MKKTLTFTSLALATIFALSACSSTGSDEGSMESSSSPDTMHSQSMEHESMSSDSTEHMDKDAMGDDKMSDDKMGDSAMAHDAKYISYEDYQSMMGSDHGMMSGATVLFFDASWCPDCRAIKEKFTSDPSVIPDNVTVVDVDYDSHSDLRQKYGVTMQHTFVQVDEHGDALNTWSATSPDEALNGLKS